MNEKPAIAIEVSPEMTTLIGPGATDQAPLPAEAALLIFSPRGDACPPMIRIVAEPEPNDVAAATRTSDVLALLVKHHALKRLFGWSAEAYDGAQYHLSHELGAIALSLRSCDREGGSLTAYRLAKSIELLCEAVAAIQADNLVPIALHGALTERDTRAIVTARRLIDKQWHEKLTLDGIARAVGINRAKLTRGFRDLYGRTVIETLAERRLVEARAKLLTTDLPVSTIGYASGYLNNASFTRAFGRRFGVSPSDCRAIGRAA